MDSRYVMAHSTSNVVNIAKLLREHDSDPAVKVAALLESLSLHLEPIYVLQDFIPKLRDCYV